MKPLFYFITLLLARSYATSQGIELVVPRYHNGSIISLDLSADGKFLISAGDDNTIFLREASTGNYLREFEEKAKVKAIKFLADSKHFIIQTSNGIAIRDIGNQGVKQQLDGEFDWIIASTHRNEFLAMSSNVITQYTEIRNVFKLTKTIHAGPGGLRSCSYSDDGQKLIINDGAIRSFDFITGKFTPVNLKSIKPDSIQSMALHKNNFTLAIGLKNGAVKFFDLKNNLVVDSLKLFQTYWSGQYSKGIVKDSIAIRYPVRKLFFTRFGQLVAYYSGTVNNEDLDPGFVNPEDLDRMWDNLQKELDGRRTTPNQLIALWDVVQRRAKYLEQNTEYDYPFALLNDQIASKKGVQNYVTGEKMIYEGANSKVAKAKFSADGGKLLVDVNERIRIWNLVTGSSYVLDHKLLRRDHFDTHRNFIGVDDYYNSGNPALLDMDAGKIDRQLKVNGYGVGLNSSKTQLAFIERDTVSVVDFSINKLLYHEYLDQHYSYSFYEDGMFFISGNTILNSEGYSRIDSIPAEHQYGIQPVFIPDHRLLFMNAGNIIIVRDYASRVNTDTLTCFYGNENEIVIDKHFHPTYDLRKDELTRSEITAMDASPDKKSLALAFSNGLIVLIDPNDLRIIKTLPASAGAVKSIDFSPDGRFLIATSADGSIRFWDLKNYEVIAKILFYGKDWVVVNHNNLFDGSAGGLAKLFFINGLQTIELNQLKTRYYEPGLLKKITRGEKLRNVLGFNKVELPPEIRVGQVDKKGNLPGPRPSHQTSYYD